MYRMDSTATKEIALKDPFNKYLTHQNIKRLEAEFVRDNALEISELLNKKMFGRSVMPYQPEGHYDQMNFPRRKYVNDMNVNQYRRGVYTHWQRTFLHPMLVAFDAPSREDSCSRRSVSNTPLQALNLLNDPSFVEAAISLADKAISWKLTSAETITKMFEKATGRIPTAAEASMLESYYKKQLTEFTVNQKANVSSINAGMYKPVNSGAELLAWTSVARVILNLHEFVTVY
jgi:hypothetical protein